MYKLWISQNYYFDINKSFVGEALKLMFHINLSGFVKAGGRAVPICKTL